MNPINAQVQAGGTDSLRVVLSDPITGLPYSTSVTGGSHVYGFDGSGNLITDTLTNGSIVRVKTYTWTNGVLTAESDWVIQ
jgi:hypothetical protein